MTDQELIQTLGVVMACLDNVKDNKEDRIDEHYDCHRDLLEIQRQLKARNL